MQVQKTTKLMLSKLKKNQVIIGSYPTLLYNMQSLPLEVRNDLKFLDEYLMIFPVVIYTRRDFHLLWVLNEKIDSLNAAGLIEYWSLSKNLRFKEDEFPQKLSLDHLQGCFEILILGILISFTVFVCECIYHNIRLRKSNLLIRN